MKCRRSADIRFRVNRNYIITPPVSYFRRTLHWKASMIKYGEKEVVLMKDHTVREWMYERSPEPQSGFYVLKHKDKDVAMIQMDTFTGRLEYVLAVYLPEELPVGCRADGKSLSNWWSLRAIPDSRKDLRQVLSRTGVETSQALLLRSYGLSLTDHYWVQPIDRELYWKDLNFFENDFSEELGNLLTDSEEDVREDVELLRVSPSASVNGDMKKKWIIRDGVRSLLKVNTNHYGQQAVNEVIAGRMHERLGWKDHVPYRVEKIRIGGHDHPCSISPLFTSETKEFVPAYQLLMDHKIPNESSLYESLVLMAVEMGMEEEKVRRQLEYMIMTDFILSNTDRHLNNMGFLYDPEHRRFTDMAPIFDTGNALFYDRAVIPHKENLLDINVNSFCKREADMLRYVKKPILDVEKLTDFPEEAESLLRQYTDMPGGRAGEIAETIREKTAYLSLFLNGKKIWKKEQYW